MACNFSSRTSSFTWDTFCVGSRSKRMYLSPVSVQGCCESKQMRTASCWTTSVVRRDCSAVSRRKFSSGFRGENGSEFGQALCGRRYRVKFRRLRRQSPLALVSAGTSSVQVSSGKNDASSTRVIVDNDSHEKFTVVNVEAPNRVGIFPLVTSTLKDLGLQILDANADLAGGFLREKFYVTDTNGEKFTDDGDARNIETVLKAALNDIEIEQPWNAPSRITGVAGRSTATKDSLQDSAYNVRDRLIERWNDTKHFFRVFDTKRIEFLMGRSLLNSVYNRGIKDQYAEALRQLWCNLEVLTEQHAQITAAVLSSASSQRSWSTSIMVSAVAATLTMAQALAPYSENIPGSWSVPPAEAVLYSPDTKVPRSAEVALRRAIPAVNPTMRKMQESLEDIFYLLRIPQRKPYGTMESDVKKTLQLARDNKEAILASVPSDFKQRGVELYNELTGLSGLEKMLEAIANKDADKVSIRLANNLEMISDLEVIQAPGLAFLVPTQYQDYPRLTGRATVQMKLEKGDGSSFTVAAGGGPQKTAELEMVLDGYSAPLTAGNFADLVVKGHYNNVKLRTGEQSILCDDQGDGVGNAVPVEILPAGEFQPLYQTTLNVQDGEIPVLPLSVYGAVAMAHNTAAEDFSSPSQFFFYLYDKRNAGLGGLAFDEGQFSVFGYVTKGKELLSQLKTGDIIQSATMVSGQDRLLIPSSGS